MFTKTRTDIGQRVLKVTLAANIFLALLKIVVGFLASSAALVADGFHSISDIASSAGVLIAVAFASRPPDDNHHYGHGQAEPLAAVMIGMILFITAALLAYNMVGNLIAGEVSIPGTMALYAAFISIVVKELMYRYTIKAGEETDNQALKADAWHHRSDAFSSVAALIGIAAARIGFWFLDPVAGIVVAVMVFKVGYEILEEGFITLLGKAPAGNKILEIKEQIIEVDGVEDILDVKGRYNGPVLYLDIKIAVSPTLTVEEGHEIAARVKSRLLERYIEAEEVLVHVDPAGNNGKGVDNDG
ncbi:cation transporter [Halanaerobiaceae bacterium Z-7014]|uniref:Cation transporter n=1 Tax=Halonatronomonas betaini TaxID=2778430 RepID=A0A931AVF5_9FIRM|nr:cation diffusion facilitator family transporter [Halonatronomonas betaini]MBF8437210.1 cation transporter [Halonatronomonas betaini]